MANKKARELEIKQAKKDRYDMAKKTLKIWPFVTVAIILVSVAFFFLNWVEIYNTDINPHIELKASGFECISAALKNNYTSADSPLFIFYHWVHDEYNMISIDLFCWATVAAVIVMVLTVILEIVMFFTKDHSWSLITVVLTAVSSVALFIAFGAALSVSGPILKEYCNNNPACSINSYAIVPALIMLAAVAIEVIHYLKYKDTEKYSDKK